MGIKTNEKDVGFLTESEVNDLVKKAKAGDNFAWAKLHTNFERYVHSRAWDKLNKFIGSDSQKQEIEEELFQSGWVGFGSAVQNYIPGADMFLTYVTPYIDGEMFREWGRQINTLGLTNRPKSKKTQKDKKTSAISRSDIDVYTMLSNSFIRSVNGNSIPTAPDRGKYSADRGVLQLLDILRMITDENHTISKKDLGKCLYLYRVAKLNNGTPKIADNTLTAILENMLQEIKYLHIF